MTASVKVLLCISSLNGKSIFHFLPSTWKPNVKNMDIIVK
jgi:hypothetical protein